MSQLMSPPQRRNWLAPLPRGPFSPLGNWDSFLEPFSEEAESAWRNLWLAPPLDLSENEKQIMLRMDLPGVDPKEIDIQVCDNCVTVSGEKKEEKDIQGDTYHRVERRSGKFSRSMMLPCAVEEDKVEAKYKDGVLRVTMPKTAEAKARHIAVKTG